MVTCVGGWRTVLELTRNDEDPLRYLGVTWVDGWKICLNTRRCLKIEVRKHKNVQKSKHKCVRMIQKIQTRRHENGSKIKARRCWELFKTRKAMHENGSKNRRMKRKNSSNIEVQMCKNGPKIKNTRVQEWSMINSNC